MHLLVRHLLQQRPLVDKHVFWLNTQDPEDRAYMFGLRDAFPDFFEVWEANTPHKLAKGADFNAFNIYPYFERCVELDTTYIRLDDDIVWMHGNAIFNLLKCRQENPHPPLIYGTILNNGIINHLLQRFGRISTEIGTAQYNATGNSWKDPKWAEWLHEQVLPLIEGNQSYKLQIPNWLIMDHERVSINCISWEGATFAQFDGKVGKDEELWLTSQLPKLLHQPSLICGDALVSHFAYYPQRTYLDTTGLLARYEALCP